MRAVQNPEVMREHMRNQDRQLSNIEGLPGGMNALQNMYTEVLRPIEDGMTPGVSSQPSIITELAAKRDLIAR